MRRLLAIMGFLGLLWAGIGSAQAATCTLPYILQQGTIPNAQQVMADFYALLNCINQGTGGGGGGQVFTCSNTPGICPFSIPMFWPGIPPGSQVVRISMTDTVTCPASLPNSEGAAKTAATGSPVVNIYQVVSGTPTLRATATFTAGTPAFAAASAFNLAIGDVVQYQFPASPDATMADVSLTLHCNRTSGSAVGSAGAPLPDGDIWVGNPTGLAQAQTPTGDLSMTDAGIFSVLKIHGTSVPASPTAGQTILATSGAAATWGLVPNASLVNSATVVNGQICALGGSCTVTGATGANPTASVGTAAVNGSAGTFLRSDGAPAIDQTMSPTWTGVHAFNEVHGKTETVTLTSNNYAAVVADCGKTKLLPTGTSPTVTLPNIAPASGSCTIVFITTVAKSYLFNVASGGSKQNSQAFYNTRGTNAGDTVVVTLTAPSVSAAAWNISGDTTS